MYTFTAETQKEMFRSLNSHKKPKGVSGKWYDWMGPIQLPLSVYYWRANFNFPLHLFFMDGELQQLSSSRLVIFRVPVRKLYISVSVAYNVVKQYCLYSKSNTVKTRV